MYNRRLVQNCIYNILYCRFNQDFGNEKNFSYDLRYPSFYNLQNPYFHVNQALLAKMNKEIHTSVKSFKDRLYKDQITVNEQLLANSKEERHYKIISNYDITFNKNHVLSIPNDFMVFVDDNGSSEDIQNYYNVDLLSGKSLELKDIFIHDIDHASLIRNYIKYKIKQNKDMYIPNVKIEINDNVPFYLTDEALILCFKPGKIADDKYGTIYFKMTFEKFAPYIEERYSCIPKNLNPRMLLAPPQRSNKKRKNSI